MKRMIGFELEKIWSKKIVRLGLLLLLLFGLLSSIAGIRREYDVITPQGEELTGKEGKAYIKEKVREYAGLLNDEKKETILKREAAADTIPYSYLYELPLYTAMRETFMEEYGAHYGETVDEAYTKQGITVEVGYADRWTGLLNLMQQFTMILGVVILVALSGVFSEEYTRGTDALILTSRHGKKKSIHAKILASFLFTTGCYVLLLLCCLIPFLADDGWYGWDAGIQLDTQCSLSSTPFTLNCGQAALLFFVSGLLSMLLLTAVTLFVSAVSRTAFLSVVLCAVLYFLPILVANLLPMKWIMLTPLGASMVDVIRMEKISFLGLSFFFQAEILAVTGLTAGLSWIFSRRCFAKHQVA